MYASHLLAFLISAAPSPDSAIQTLDSMRVTAPRAPRQERVQIAAEEKISGLTDNINRVLYMQPGVDRVPEAGSTLLINGGGPYDNAFYVYGVPMFAPSHFTNHSFADRSGTMVSSLKSVGLATSNLAGRFPEATGGVVEFRPEIYRPANARLVRRPEIVVDAGTLDIDLQASRPSRLHRDDFYELSYKHAWAYNLRWLNLSHLLGQTAANAHLGNAPSGAYGDLVLSGTNDRAHVKSHELVWVAYDLYNPDGEQALARPMVPWGCAVLDIETKRPDAFLQSGGAGATHQLVFEGKRIGPAIPLKTVSRTGGALFARTNTRNVGRLGLRGGLRADGLSWWGTCVDRRTGITTRSVNGNELLVSLQGEASHSVGALDYGVNLLGAVAGTPLVAFVDPGVYARLTGSKGGIEMSGGISSSRPDIRGLPDQKYRGTLNKTYGGSVALRLAPLSWTSLEALGYLRYSRGSPAFSDTASNLWWDPRSATPLLAGGADFQWDVRMRNIATLRVVQNLNHAQRIHGEGRATYEWDLPWSTKAMLGLKLLRGFLDVYVIGHVSAGLPYRTAYLDADSIPRYGEMRRSINYRRVDLKVQFGQPIDRHRFLTRYDVYVDATNVLGNILGWVNAREYYWDDAMQQHPILLQPRLVSLGLRMGFRL